MQRGSSHWALYVYLPNMWSTGDQSRMEDASTCVSVVDLLLVFDATSQHRLLFQAYGNGQALEPHVPMIDGEARQLPSTWTTTLATDVSRHADPMGAYWSELMRELRGEEESWQRMTPAALDEILTMFVARHVDSIPHTRLWIASRDEIDMFQKLSHIEDEVNATGDAGSDSDEFQLQRSKLELLVNTLDARSKPSVLNSWLQTHLCGWDGTTPPDTETLARATAWSENHAGGGRANDRVTVAPYRTGPMGTVSSLGRACADTDDMVSDASASGEIPGETAGAAAAVHATVVGNVTDGVRTAIATARAAGA